MVKTILVLLAGLGPLLHGPGRCHGSRILVVPLDGSHWLNMEVILRELHARGHSMTVLRSAKSWYIPQQSPYYTSINVHTFTDELDMSFYLGALQRFMKHRQLPTCMRSFRQQFEIASMLHFGHEISVRSTASVLDDRALMQQLKDAKFDLMLTDPGVPTGTLLGAYLHLPMVYNVRWTNTGVFG